MAFKQQRFVFNLTDENGNVIMYFPVTSIDYVEGAIKDISVVDETLTITYVDGSKKVLTGIAGSGKGEKGDKGDDGISATHKWNGTVLTITSASGTSSADLKGEKGDKGQDGYTPIKGVDYFDGKDGVDGQKGDRGEQGVSGVYVGSGDMPDGYNVQIDIGGDATVDIPTVQEVQAMIDASLGVIENGSY